MKICTKCKKEYPDDMVFCSYCGISLQPKIEERVCSACGKVVHADNLRFCPYCGHSFTSPSPKTNAPNSTKIPLPPSVNIKKNYVKMQPLNQEKKSATTPLESDVQRNVCPSCHSVIYAKNLSSCPYCGEKIDFSNKANTTINAKPRDNGNNHSTQESVCPSCGKLIHAKNLNSCPYCGKSLKDNSMDNNGQPTVNANKPLPPTVNIKKNYVKMQPLNQEEKPSTNETSKSVTNKPTNTVDSDNTNSTGSKTKSIGSLLMSFLSIVGFLLVLALSKACGRALVRDTTPQQKGFFIGAALAGVVSGIIPAFVAYKYCKFDNPFNAVWAIFILQIIISFLCANGIIPLGSIPIGIILAILLYLFNKK